MLTRKMGSGYDALVMNGLSPMTAPLVLLFALVLLSGAGPVFAAYAAEAGTASDYCCQQESDERAPAPDGGEGECTDPACGCLSCSASMLSQGMPIPSSLAGLRLCWSNLSQAVPFPPACSIDYPPESA